MKRNSMGTPRNFQVLLKSNGTNKVPRYCTCTPVVITRRKFNVLEKDTSS